jgi:Flp pilus assembly protein TadD
MTASARRVLLAATACFGLLSGCETSTKLGDMFQSKADDQATASLSSDRTDNAEAAVTGSVDAPSPGPAAATGSGLLGSEPNDDLSLGKKQYRAGNFGLAERYFRRAAELHPRDAEVWLGLAACYDRLRRFDLADRAYGQAIAVSGPRSEILNNKGYSYILRGDYRHARETLLAAQMKDPANPYIKNNLDLLDQAARGGKAVQ